MKRSTSVLFALLLVSGFTSCDQVSRMVEYDNKEDSDEQMRLLEEAVYKQCTRPIMGAWWEFEAQNRFFPAQYSKDPSGRRLLSWRVHILPYLGEESLYKRFALDEPWDSETNKTLISEMPDCFKHPYAEPIPGKTVFQVVEGVDVMAMPPRDDVDDSGIPLGVKLKEIKDGLSFTGFLVEVVNSHAVTWTEPRDFDYKSYAKPVAELRSMNGKSLIGGLACGGYYDTEQIGAEFEKIVVLNDWEFVQFLLH